MPKRYKTFDELTYTDDFMFKKVMTDPSTLPAVKWIINIATGKNVKEIIRSEYEKTIETTGRGVRLDVVFEGDSNIYDIEMQTYNDDLRQRAEYYLSSLDIETLEKEDNDYTNIKHKYLIYILTNDFLKFNDPIIHEEMRIVEHLDAPTKGFRTIVYINTTVKTEDANLKAFFKFVQENNATNEMTNLLSESIMKTKRSKGNRKNFMDLINSRRIEREEALKEGIKKGIQKGRKEGLAEGRIVEKQNTAKNLLSMGMSEDDISKATGLSLNAIQDIKKYL